MNKAFYDAVRASLFNGTLSQPQVDGIESIIDAWREHGDSDNRKLAYVFATAFHETGATMHPVEENLNYSATRLRQVWPSRFTVAEAKACAHNPEAIANRAYGSRMGNMAAGDGWRYRGRGLPQITGLDNYRKMGREVGVDLVKEPDRALDPAIAGAIAVKGMMKGLFTGKKLADYFGQNIANPLGARATINGKDRAADIAQYWKAFDQALFAAAAAAPQA